MNRLKAEKSPYLRMHAENPVDWYPWGAEAFAAARAQDRPVFLSIGYSACHWCHVIAHESFEDAEVAALLNADFISVKVDREERPDLDAVYMDAVQLATGSGGWPMTLLLTPEGAPFFAATYLPRESRDGMVGMVELLAEAAALWRSDRAAVLRAAAEFTQHMRQLAEAPVALCEPNEALLRRAVADFASVYDRQWGGFGRAPKFPSAHNLLFLLSRAGHSDGAEARNQAGCPDGAEALNRAGCLNGAEGRNPAGRMDGTESLNQAECPDCEVALNRAGRSNGAESLNQAGCPECTESLNQAGRSNGAESLNQAGCLDCTESLNQAGCPDCGTALNQAGRSSGAESQNQAGCPDCTELQNQAGCPDCGAALNQAGRSNGAEALNQAECPDGAEALELAEGTLRAMARGGMFDHVGGGFCRYSVDRMWLIPHFEKMLYDNALLLWTYAWAWKRTGDALYRDVAERTAGYVLRELTGPEGEFYCAQDADSEGREGAYYAFTPDELRALLGEADGQRFCRWYGVTEDGNFEGASVPNRIGGGDALPDGPICALRERVLAYRRERLPLNRDDKVLTGWNALTIAALCEASRALDRQDWLQAARRAEAFLHRYLTRPDGGLWLRYREGEARGDGVLTDYAAYALALTELYESTGERAYLCRAEVLASAMEEHFADAAGGFFLYADRAEPLLTRPREAWDAALPCGNSFAALALLRLADQTGDARWRDAAERQLHFIAGAAQEQPTGLGFGLLAIDQALAQRGRRAPGSPDA